MDGGVLIIRLTLGRMNAGSFVIGSTNMSS